MRFGLLLAVSVSLFAVADGMIHTLHLKRDTRASFLIESFGFGIGGTLNITAGPFVVVRGWFVHRVVANFFFFFSKKRKKAPLFARSSSAS